MTPPRQPTHRFELSDARLCRMLAREFGEEYAGLVVVHAERCECGGVKIDLAPEEDA